MATFEYDLRYVQTGVGELKDYLLSKELFWPVTLAADAGQPPYPKLTPGNLLLSLARMQAQSSGASQASALAQVEGDLNVVVTKWRVKWEEKVSWEFTSRLRQWVNYLKDFGQEPAIQGAYYPNEVRLRVQMELLRQAVPISAENAAALDAADGRVRAKLKPGDFIWGEELAAGFPESIYWFLYGKF